MTTKQKQNIARFKAVQVEAKKLKAKNKNLSHTEAVKQAWAKFKKSSKSIKGDQLDLFSSAPKKAAKKSKTKRPVDYQYGKSNLERDQQRKALSPGKRKSASGRTYYEYRANRSDAGKLLGTKTHKDTKSHNVNIRVVSGINDVFLKELSTYVKVLNEKEKTYNFHKTMSTNKDRAIDLKREDKEMMKVLKKQIINLKKHITQIKKQIK